MIIDKTHSHLIKYRDFKTVGVTVNSSKALPLTKKIYQEPAD